MSLQELGLSPEAEALAQALLLGDKSALSADVIDAYRTAGMSHIMAVSGLHVGIVMSLLWLLFQPIEWLVILVSPVRMLTHYILGDVKRILVIAATVSYVIYIGAPPSAVRAALMLSLLLLGWMFQRPTSTWRCLALAAFILLAWDPWTITTPGFQLSFLAVVGILLFQPWLQSELLPRWWRLILLSVAAQWFTTPIVAFWFHQVPFFGWLQGLLVVPLLPLLIGSLIIGLVFPSFTLSGFLVEVLTAWMGWVAQMVGRIESLVLGGHLYFYPNWWQTLMAEVMFLAIYVYLRLTYAPTKQQLEDERLRQRDLEEQNIQR